jgi:hypothetical protein
VPTVLNPVDEELLPGGRPRRWRLRWSPTVRALSAAAAVLTLIAAGFGLLAGQTQPRHRILTVVAEQRPPATTTDAAGCPVDRMCRVDGSAGTAVIAAFVRTYPAGRVVLGEQTIDVASGRVYRISLTSRIDRVTSLVLLSQCVPGGTAVPREDVRRVTEAHVDLNGDWVVYARGLTALVPGAPGCSVHLSVDRMGDAEIDDRAALALARDPAVRARP